MFNPSVQTEAFFHFFQLPEDLETPDDSSSLSEFDPTVISVGTRPLVNVWIPSVFFRGGSSNVHHVYQVKGSFTWPTDELTGRLTS